MGLVAVLGQLGVNLNAQLLFIQWIKIGGTEVYKAKSKQVAEQADLQQPAADFLPESIEG